MSNESLRSFHFQQIASWPVHVKTAWKYKAAQSFIAPGVTDLTGFKLYCINYFPLYHLMQASSLKVVTQSFCVTKQTEVSIPQWLRFVWISRGHVLPACYQY